MKQFRLTYTMRVPTAETEDMYLAEVPGLPGCRAWGQTPDETLLNLQSVAQEFIRSYHDHDDALPDSIEVVTAGQILVPV